MTGWADKIIPCVFDMPSSADFSPSCFQGAVAKGFRNFYKNYNVVILKWQFVFYFQQLESGWQDTPGWELTPRVSDRPLPSQQGVLDGTQHHQTYPPSRLHSACVFTCVRHLCGCVWSRWESGCGGGARGPSEQCTITHDSSETNRTVFTECYQ